MMRCGLALNRRSSRSTKIPSLAEAYFDQQSHDMPIGGCDAMAIQRQIESVTAKRGRILEAFFDGTIDREKGDEKLAGVDAELKAYQAFLRRRQLPHLYRPPT